MLAYITLLNLELDVLKPEDYIEPYSDIIRGDTVVGTMSEDSVKLYTLWMQTCKAYEERRIEFMFSVAKPGRERERLACKVSELEDKSDFIRDLFWVSLKEELHLWGKSIGVRSSRRVVIIEDEPHRRIMGMILGDSLW